MPTYIPYITYAYVCMYVCMYGELYHICIFELRKSTPKKVEH
jgi:hypothetical protein